MSRKTPPDTAAHIVAMRAAGYTVPLIAERTGVSTSTVKRTLRRHQQAAGAESDLDLVELAREDLWAQFSTDEALRGLYDTLLADTLHHIETSREAASEALRHLKATDTRDAALIFRALTAHATTLKAHVDTIRVLAPRPELADELPTLQITVINPEEVEEMRQQQEAERAEFGW